MLNIVIIEGRLVADPELKKTPAGTSITTLRIACQRDFQADGQPSADFLDVVAFRSTADFICRWFKKGQIIKVVGRLQRRGWETPTGEKRTTVEILADKAYFGEKKAELEDDEDQFTDLGEDDGSLPF